MSEQYTGVPRQCLDCPEGVWTVYRRCLVNVQVCGKGVSEQCLEVAVFRYVTCLENIQTVSRKGGCPCSVQRMSRCADSPYAAWTVSRCSGSVLMP